MDKKTIGAYFKFTLQKLKSEKIVYIVFFYICIYPLLLNEMNNFSIKSNCWEGVFFILGSRHIYILCYLLTFIAILYVVIKDDEIITFTSTRLCNKINWLVAKLLVIVLMDFIYTLISFLSNIINSILILGFDKGWNKFCLSGECMYTTFASKLSPLGSLFIYIIRYSLVLLAISFIAIALMCLFKNMNNTKVFLIIVIFIFLNLLFNVGNIPVLSILNISNNLINYFKNNYFRYILFMNFNIFIMIFTSIFISFLKIKKVEFK